ncbi:hypothetical protein ACOSQ4_022519 [Xanthoceras sorbifolium]
MAHMNNDRSPGNLRSSPAVIGVVPRLPIQGKSGLNSDSAAEEVRDQEGNFNILVVEGNNSNSVGEKMASSHNYVSKGKSLSTLHGDIPYMGTVASFDKEIGIFAIEGLGPKECQGTADKEIASSLDLEGAAIALKNLLPVLRGLVAVENELDELLSRDEAY